MASRSISVYNPKNKGTEACRGKGRRDTTPPRGSFLTSEAYIRYSTLIAGRGILAERGFLTTPNIIHKYPSCLKERFQTIGWTKYATHPESIYPQIVREVYANLPREPSDVVYFRGSTVDISPKAINDVLGLENSTECQFDAIRKNKMTEEVYKNIIRCTCYEGAKWVVITKSSRHLTFDMLLPGVKVWYYFVAASLCPTKETLMITEEIAALLFCIVNEYHIDVGKIIARKIRTHSNRRTDMIFPAVIGELMKGHFERSLEECTPVEGRIDPTIVRKIMVPDFPSEEESEANEGIPQQGSPSS